MITRLGEVGKTTSEASASKFGILSTEGLVAVRMHGNQAFGKWVQAQPAVHRVVGKNENRP
ncbi:hypothetical protein [Cephaloticoccus capnophilus]|uniref:hypothetical protein n=1 Tax=Cephaloticoccus capnophilus TaxID=1548208 RepID=UPI0012E825AA|nr:hypothetical protein [Cephaloticoccus capnophilus]